jgi:hypothetical protein
MIRMRAAGPAQFLAHLLGHAAEVMISEPTITSGAVPFTFLRPLADDLRPAVDHLAIQGIALSPDVRPFITQHGNADWRRTHNRASCG